jgi:hypothetical protein
MRQAPAHRQAFSPDAPARIDVTLLGQRMPTDVLGAAPDPVSQ